MPRPKHPVPKLTLHKPSGQARVRWTDCNGQRHSRDLGPYTSTNIQELYERFLAEWRVVGEKQQLARKWEGSLSVAELFDRFTTWAESYYRRADGTQTNEVGEIIAASGPVLRLYGTSPAAAFGPLALKAVQSAMIEVGWCRTRINRQVDRIRRAFKWAASEEMLPVTVYDALRTVPGLKRGRTRAREHPPVRPVRLEDVEAIRPHVQPEIWAMIEVQRLSGMRPQDVCNMVPADIDRTGDVWVYQPGQHKGTHLGKVRLILIGPQSQALLAPLIEGMAPDEHVFSPIRTLSAWRVRKRAARKTKVQPSQVARQEKRDPGSRTPGQRYTVVAYNHAIRRGCQKAGVPMWSANQLRHATGTFIRKKFGLEAAQAVLGHERADVTQVYAEKNHQLARQVIASIG